MLLTIYSARLEEISRAQDTHYIQVNEAPCGVSRSPLFNGLQLLTSTASLGVIVRKHLATLPTIRQVDQGSRRTTTAGNQATSIHWQYGTYKLLYKPTAAE